MPFPIFSTFPPQWCKGRGNGGCSQFSSSSLCYSFILAFFCCSSMGLLPWDTVLHKLFQCGSSPAWRLQFFMRCSSMGAFQRVWGNLYSRTWSTSFPSFTDPGVYRNVSLTPFPISPSPPPKELYLRGVTILTDGLGHGQHWVYPAAGWD